MERHGSPRFSVNGVITKRMMIGPDVMSLDTSSAPPKSHRNVTLENGTLDDS
jgi:hypothetical protein